MIKSISGKIFIFTIQIFLIFPFMCDIPPKPSFEHKLAAAAVFRADKKIHSVFVDTTYDLNANLPYSPDIFPMPGMSGAVVELVSSDSTYYFTEDTLIFGCHGDYVCSLTFYPGDDYVLKISYESFDPLIVDFTFPDSISLIYPGDCDTIQVGSKVKFYWSSVDNISSIDKYLLTISPEPIGINELTNWINRNDTLFTIEKFGMSNSGNNIVYGYSNNWVTVKISSNVIYESPKIENGYGYIWLEYPDTIMIFSSIDSILSTWK